MKTYYDFMSEITPDELYDRIVEYGMFSEKLPPVFSANSFLTYCKTKRTQPFSDVGYGYITYENIRNINVPRNIGIPTPMGHELLCKCLSDNWDKIKEHFKECTKGQPRIVSRIHIRIPGKHILGCVLGRGINGNDGIFPHEFIRTVLDEYDDEEINSGFMIGKSNALGVRSVGDGSGEKKRADAYFEAAKTIEIDNPVTANILRKLAKEHLHTATEDNSMYQLGFDI